MFTIDQFAYANKLKHVHPAEKAVMALFTLLVCQVANSWVISVLILTLMAGLTVYKAGIPWRVWLRMMAFPGAFFLVGAMAVLIHIGYGTESQLLAHAWQIGPWTLGVMKGQLPLVVLILTRGLASVSCMFFLILTTPMLEIMVLLRYIKIPALFIELTELIYRFIFVLLENALAIYTAQGARLGYSTVPRSFRSFGTLVVVLFMKTYQRATQLQWALEARGYDGELRVLVRKYPASFTNWAGIGLVQFTLIAVAIYSGGMI